MTSLFVVACLGGCNQGEERERQARLAGFGEQAGAVLGPDAEAASVEGAGLEEGGEPEAPPPGSPFADAAPTGWTVVLAAVPAEAGPIGEQLAARARGEHGLSGARVIERGGKLLVATGSFADPGSREAQAELERVRGVRAGGTSPYAYAFLAPPPEARIEGTNPAHDLRRARAQYGADALYTLQVAVYGHQDGRAPSAEELELFRRTAEQAVTSLRGEGELAYYYHDRARSSVTVGIFGPEDHDPSLRPPMESARLEQTRERHPYNLLNGQGIKQRVRGPDGQWVETLQKSFLVAVPEG